MGEEIDAELAQIENEIKELEANPTSSPSSITGDKGKDTLIQLAREMIESNDTRKFGNLAQKHIGIPKMPINSYLEIAEYCDVEGLADLSKVFRAEAEIALATSLSADGTFIRLLVTQIKKDEKTPEKKEAAKQSWGLFKQKYGAENNG
jgi:hypothetical protein